MSVVLAALSALSYGAADYIGGRATRGSSVLGVLAVSQFVGMLGILVTVLIIGTPFPGTRDLVWGMIAGLSGVLGLSFLYTGLARSAAAVVSPTAALVGSGMPVIAGLILRETPGALGFVGIGLALPSILLLSLSGSSGEPADRGGLGYGLAAGTGFGAYFILIAQTAPESGLWPLVAARVASIAAILIVAAIVRVRSSADARKPLHVSRPSLGPVAGVGALDMAANVFFLLAARSGMLMVSAVISSLYPAPTVVLARVFDRERLTLIRTIGLILALAGVTLLSL